MAARGKRKAAAPSAPSDGDLVLQYSQTFEKVLKQYFNATGKGLKELADSVTDQLPAQTHKLLCDIAAIRNKVVHEGYNLTDANRKTFTGKCQKAIHELEMVLKHKSARQATTGKSAAVARLPTYATWSQWMLPFASGAIFAFAIAGIGHYIRPLLQSDLWKRN